VVEGGGGVGGRDGVDQLRNDIGWSWLLQIRKNGRGVGGWGGGTRG
jgi:hypothetical protein